jgi:hypothetical protein
MAISTPKSSRGSDKLYGYLKGFETAQFTGSSKSEVIKSIHDLLQDECSVLLPGNTEVIHQVSTYVVPLIDRFLTQFYSRMQNITNPFKVKDLADKAKKDSKSLSHLVSLVVQGNSTPMDCLGYATLNSKFEVNNVIDICDKCPYYIQHKFCIIYELVDEDGSIDGSMFQLLIPESRFLVQSILRLMHILIKQGIELNSLVDYYMLFNHILTASKLFECMNPSGEARRQQMLETIDLLTGTPLNTKDEKYQFFDQILELVFNDIREGKKKYIKDIKKALDDNKDFINSKYDEQNDCYVSIKGTAQVGYTKRNQSLVSSAFEVDYYKDYFTEFDEYVGFHSYYIERGEFDLEKDKLFCIRTILINNPGKFKGRIIHIFDNPLQDRANYIHRRLKAVLDSMRCDCTSNQGKGRDFLQAITGTWFLTKNKQDKEGIYAFDFSNATDTLDQHFQERVLEFVFGPVIAKFWTQVSRLPKFYQDPVSHEMIKYDQFRGQPQGGLGSFDGFALAHHFIFLMDMKLLGMEDTYSWDVYRILGDDSICTTAQPEFELYDPSTAWIDPEGVKRSEFERIHIAICNDFAGFIVNYDKSDAVHWDSDEAKLDFAKVTYRNGRFFSPIPFRLAMRYSRNNDSKFAVAIWRGERHESSSIAFMDKVLSHYNNELITNLVKCGEIPYLAIFADNTSRNSAWLARVRYSYIISSLIICLSSISVKDKDRDYLQNMDTFVEAFDKIFGKQDQLCLDKIPPRHKVFNLIERNEEILNSLKELCSFNEEDERMISLLISPAFKGDISSEVQEYLITLAHTQKILCLAKENKDIDVSLIFPDFNMSWKSQILQFENSFVTRSTTRRPVEEVVLFNSLIDQLNSLDDVLGKIEPVQ